MQKNLLTNSALINGGKMLFRESEQRGYMPKYTKEHI